MSNEVMWTTDMVATLRHMRLIEHRGIALIAERLGVSPSVVVRYCHLVGIDAHTPPPRRRNDGSFGPPSPPRGVPPSFPAIVPRTNMDQRREHRRRMLAHLEQSVVSV